MTDAIEGAKPGSNIRTIKDCAVDWLERSEREEFSEADGHDLEEWLAESTSHRVAFWHAKSAWQRAERLQALRPRDSMAEQYRETRRGWSILVRSAAAVMVIGLSGAVSLWMSRSHERTLATAHGEREVASLADGSKIELNTDTEVRLDVRAGQRKVELLHGEAYFQIAHDSANPFTVIAGDHRIRDLGTKFLVQKSAAELRVSLLEGKAQVESVNQRDQRKPIVLKPGDIAMVNASGTSVSRKPLQELSDDLAWRHGGLVFHNATLAEAVAQFNRYGTVKLIVADPNASKLTINGAFRTTGAENFAGVAREIFGLRVEHRDSDIILSR